MPHLRITLGMNPEQLRFRAMLALSKANVEGGGKAAPEIAQEARERKQARRERAAAYRGENPEVIHKAAAGVPATRAEFRAALATRDDDDDLRHRIGRMGRVDLPIDHPDHPDPEAAVLRHHILSYRRERRE